MLWNETKTWRMVEWTHQYITICSKWLLKVSCHFPMVLSNLTPDDISHFEIPPSPSPKQWSWDPGFEACHLRETAHFYRATFPLTDYDWVWVTYYYRSILSHGGHLHPAHYSAPCSHKHTKKMCGKLGRKHRHLPACFKGPLTHHPPRILWYYFNLCPPIYPF